MLLFSSHLSVLKCLLRQEVYEMLMKNLNRKRKRCWDCSCCGKRTSVQERMSLALTDQSIRQTPPPWPLHAPSLFTPPRNPSSPSFLSSNTTSLPSASFEHTPQILCHLPRMLFPCIPLTEKISRSPPLEPTASQCPCQATPQIRDRMRQETRRLSVGFLVQQWAVTKEIEREREREREKERKRERKKERKKEEVFKLAGPCNRPFVGGGGRGS